MSHRVSHRMSHQRAARGCGVIVKRSAARAALLVSFFFGGAGGILSLGAEGARAEVGAEAGDLREVEELRARVARLEEALMERPRDPGDYPLPSEVSFCGQVIPLTEPSVRRRFEEEVLRIVTSRPQVQLYINRARAAFPVIEREAQRLGSCPDLKHLAIVESGLRGAVTSHAKAKGWWQFMRPTASDFNLAVTPEWDARCDLLSSTRAGLTYLKRLEASFGSWELAMAAYNTGPGRLRSAQSAQRQGRFWDLDLYEEAERYVPRVLAVHYVMTHLEHFDFFRGVRHGWPAPDLVGVELSLRAESFEVTRVIEESAPPAKRASKPSKRASKPSKRASKPSKRASKPSKRASKPSKRAAQGRARVASSKGQRGAAGKGAAGKGAAGKGPSKRAVKRTVKRTVKEVSSSVSLAAVALAVGVDLRTFKEQNPGLVGDRLPLNQTFTIWLPPAAVPLLRAHLGRGVRSWADLGELYPARAVAPALAARPPTPAPPPAPPALTPPEVLATRRAEEEEGYRVKGGDSLFLLSARFGVSVSELREWNALTPMTPLRQGQPLRLSPP